MAESVPGPWSQKRTTRVVINPFDLTITTTTECSHVPPPCEAHEERSFTAQTFVDALQRGLTIVMQKLAEIRAAQGTPPG